MALEKPTIVIFDMDGTTVRHINIYLLHILEWLDDMAYAATSLFRWLSDRRSKNTFIHDWENYKKRKKPKLLVHRAIHKLRRKEVDQIVEPCPGVYELLDFLKDNNIPLALASNGLGKGYGHDILKTFDLARYFGATIFREDINKSKPNPECLHLCLKRMGITPTEKDVIWYIGDRQKDMKAALKADEQLPCKVIPVAYGVSASLAVIRKNMSPDHIIMSYFDMLASLKTQLQSSTSKSQKSTKRKTA